jgi:CubicO group peptidase (beta-lactamase class C family)
VVAPGQTPIFSNAAFQILSYVVESITGKPFEESLQEKVLDKLNLNHTSLSAPIDSVHGVIPVNETVSGWSHDFGDESP